MRHALLLCGSILLGWASAQAQPVLDQRHEITQSVGGLGSFSDFVIAQTFTAQQDGLLSQIDLQLGRDAGDIGGLTLELLPVLGGVPTDTMPPLLSTPIAAQNVPVASPSPSLPYTSVDVSGSGFAVSSGEQYAIAIRAEADFGTPNAFWNWGRPGYDLGDPYSNSFGRGWEVESDEFDFGFRTWVEANAPDTSTLALNPTGEFEATLFSSGVTSIATAGNLISVRRSVSSDDDRALLEFDTSALPDGAEITSASLAFDINFLTATNALNPIVELYGYEATGDFPTSNNARDQSRLLGTSGPILDLSTVSIDLDAGALGSLAAGSPNLGLTAFAQVAQGVGVSIVSSQFANQFPQSFQQPTLTIEFSVPAPPRLPEGDYNGDAHVDAADYTVWRDSLGAGPSPADGNNDGSVDRSDYNLWQANFGVRPHVQTVNGDFGTGTLGEWQVVVGENTNVSIGFPRVELFDTTGDGTADEAVRLRLGVINFGPDERGTAGIEQEILLEGGDYTFSADIATQSLEAFGNTGPGDYELLLNGQVIDAVNLNGTLIEAGEVIRDSLSATVTGLEPGFHTLSLTVSRRATNTRQIYHFFDNLAFTRTAAAVAVPEPSSWVLGVFVGCLAGTRRPRQIRVTHPAC